MSDTLISIIVAMDLNGLIGKGNQLPWYLPADLKHFKRTTMDKPIVMGRRTFESIGRPLPGRHNIVVTGNRDYRADGVTVVHSLDAAIAAAGDADEVMIIGGAAMYRQALDRARRIYLTRVEAELDGDTWFPQLDPSQWRVVERQSHPADHRNAHPYSLEVLDRR